MIPIASGLLSTSKNRRPDSWAATPVVPLPAKKSATRPPGGEDARTIRRRMLSGFYVGYPVRSLPLVGTIVDHQVSVSRLPRAAFSGPTSPGAM